MDKLQSGDDLAAQALASASSSSSALDETEQSDQLANTLQHLQNVIERNADQLTQLKNDLK